MRLSEIHTILAKAANDRAWADYNAYVQEMQDRQDGKLIDGTCREVTRTIQLSTTERLTAPSKSARDI